MLKRIILFLSMLIALPACTHTSTSDLPLHLIQLPPGFAISVYADNVPGARQLALGKDSIVYVGTKGEGKVYALIPDKNKTKAVNTITIATKLNEPNGVAVRDNDLYVAEINRVIRYSNITERLTIPLTPEVINDSLPTKSWHGYRVIHFGPDGRLYIAIGMSCNTCNYRDSQPMLGTIMSMQPDGKDLKIFAKGIRNSVGFDWDPATHELWFTDNGQDYMGDDLPPDEINHAPQANMDFGFPFFYGNNIPAPDYKDKNISSNGMTPPVVELPAHVAPLGMTLYQGKQFPAEYQNQIFVAEHGSWNRSSKVGYQIILVTLKNNRATSAQLFAYGWFQGQKAWGRPVDLLNMPDGSLLISDDEAGVIYRLTYQHP